MRERPFSEEAASVCESIKKLASTPEALENFESYLSCHFSSWLNKFANTPEDFAAELKAFATMFDKEE